MKVCNFNFGNKSYLSICVYNNYFNNVILVEALSFLSILLLKYNYVHTCIF